MLVSVFVVLSAVVLLVVLLAVDIFGPVADKKIGIEVQTSRAIHLPFVAVCAGKEFIALSWVRVKTVLANFFFWLFGGGVFPAVDVLGPVANKEIRV